MKAVFSITPNGDVQLSYGKKDPSDDNEVVRVQREFMVPVGGEYVRERVGNEWIQVCKKLARTGSSLTCGDRDNLLAVIRSEYRAMRRAEKREAQAEEH